MYYTIYLTTNCNFKCSYCYEDYYNMQSIKQGQMKEIINQIFSHDKSSKIFITFMGGEPLLKKDILINTVNYIKTKYPEKIVKYFITTNCSLLDEKMIYFFKDNNFQLRLSFDGIRETHDLNRFCKNGNSCYDIIFKNVCKVRDSGIPYSVRMTVPSNTISFMYKNILFFHENKIDSINLIPDVNLIFTDETLDIFKDQMLKIKKYYIEEFDHGRKFSIDQFDGKFINVLCSFSNDFKMCDGGIGNLKILPNGDIYPCEFVTNDKNFRLRHISDTIDDSYSMKVISSKYNKSNMKCKNCKIGFFCQGMKCGFMNYIRTGYINVPSDAECQEEHIFYPLVIDIIEHFYEQKTNILNGVLGGLIQYLDLEHLKLSPLGQKINKKIGNK